MDQYAAAQIQN
jgi:hypothetical protein